jgi:hypothetical protein
MRQQTWWSISWRTMAWKHSPAWWPLKSRLRASVLESWGPVFSFRLSGSCNNVLLPFYVRLGLNSLKLQKKLELHIDCIFNLIVRIVPLQKKDPQAGIWARNQGGWRSFVPHAYTLPHCFNISTNIRRTQLDVYRIKHRLLLQLLATDHNARNWHNTAQWDRKTAPRRLKLCARRLLSETYNTRTSRTARTEQGN